MTPEAQAHLLAQAPEVLLVLAIATTVWQLALVAIVVFQGVGKSMTPGYAAVALWVAYVVCT